MPINLVRATITVIYIYVIEWEVATKKNVIDFIYSNKKDVQNVLLKVEDPGCSSSHL
jgi:hypothetical protein